MKYLSIRKYSPESNSCNPYSEEFEFLQNYNLAPFSFVSKHHLINNIFTY